MGQKSNLTTIRKFLKHINLLTFSSKEFLIGFNLLEFFNRFCNLKNIFVVNTALNFIGTKAYLTLLIFVRSVKIKKLQKRIKFQLSTKRKDSFKNITFFSQFFLKKLEQLKINFLNLKIILINKQLIKEKKLLRFFYLRNQFFRESLFPRRYNLFFDFLKISCLLALKKIPSKTFLYFLGQIFKFLPKKKHARFFSFVKKVFSLFFNVKTNIMGLKLLIGGRLKGKLRKKKIFIQLGKIPSLTISKDIEFNRIHVFSKHGVFGFKFWVYFK